MIKKTLVWIWIVLIIIGPAFACGCTERHSGEFNFKQKCFDGIFSVVQWIFMLQQLKIIKSHFKKRESHAQKKKRLS